MYYLFRFHHVSPFTFKKLPRGEKMAYLAFMKYELEQRVKENTPPEGGT
jgi:hypothetical protein